MEIQFPNKHYADDVSADLADIRALLDAIDSRIYSMMDKRLWGAYWPIMQENGKNIQCLLAIAD